MPQYKQLDKIKFRLQDILREVTEILKRIDKLTEDQFRSDQVKREAIMYKLVIVGEAVNQLPKDLLEKYADTDWSAIVAMRNILIHEYREVSVDIVWDTLLGDLADLKKEVTRIIEDLKQ